MPYTVVNHAAGLAPIKLATFAGATALGAAPRAFAYTALGGSLDDLGAPEAIAAFAVLAILAVVGLVMLRAGSRRPGRDAVTLGERGEPAG